MADKPTLYICHGDTGGPKMHPCRRVQEALNAAGIEYDKVIAAHGNPLPFLRKGDRDQLLAATGAKKLPALKLPDGTVLTHSRAILSWVRDQSGLHGWRRRRGRGRRLTSRRVPRDGPPAGRLRRARAQLQPLQARGPADRGVGYTRRLATRARS